MRLKENCKNNILIKNKTVLKEEKEMTIQWTSYRLKSKVT